MTMIFDPLISITAALLLSYIFALAALHKWQSRTAFSETLAHYQILPTALLKPVTVLLPICELLTALALLIPVVSWFAAIAAIVLLCLYMLAIGVNLLRGRRTIDCGCGAADQKQAISEGLLLRNAVLIMLALLLLKPATNREVFWFDWAVIAMATAIACLFYHVFNQLLVNKELLTTLRSQHG